MVEKKVDSNDAAVEEMAREVSVRDASVHTSELERRYGHVNRRSVECVVLFSISCFYASIPPDQATLRAIFGYIRKDFTRWRHYTTP